MTARIRRGLAIGAFLALAIGFLAATHGYLALRLVLDPGWPEPARSLGIAALAALAALIVAHPIAERALPRPLARCVSWPAVALDGRVLLAAPAARSRATCCSGPQAEWRARPTRARRARAPRRCARCSRSRSPGRRSRRGCARGSRRRALRREEFAIERWPRALDGFRIVQISDIHIGPLLGREFAAQLAQRVNALAPDLVAVTGDLVDGSAPRLAAEVAPFADLRARARRLLRHGQPRPLLGRRALERGGARSRHARAAQRARRDRRARRELRSGRRRRPPRALRGRRPRAISTRALDGRDPERAAVLLAHDPATFARARRAAIDLQLSGHTHGGQIWPFAWFVRLATPYVAGRYREGARSST